MWDVWTVWDCVRSVRFKLEPEMRSCATLPRPTPPCCPLSRPVQPLDPMHSQLEPVLKASPELRAALQKVTTIAQMTVLQPVGQGEGREGLGRCSGVTQQVEVGLE